MCNKWSIRAWCRTGTFTIWKKGDIGFVFPDIIHHYQVLTPGVNTAIYLIASPFVISKFADIMQSMAPEYPIIRAEKVEQEVYRVINAILETEQPDITVAQAYLQIVLARCIGKLNLVEKSNVGEQGSDLPDGFLYISKCEPHMTKATCFSAVLNGKTGYRRIRLKLRTAQICASSMPGTAGFHITGSPPDICLCLCSFRTSILILKDEQVSINA